MALNPTTSRYVATSLCSTPPQKDCPGRENNCNGITTEGKLKFALEVALLTLPMGTDSALTAETWRAAVSISEQLGQIWNS